MLNGLAHVFLHRSRVRKLIIIVDVFLNERHKQNITALFHKLCSDDPARMEQGNVVRGGALLARASCGLRVRCAERSRLFRVQLDHGMEELDLFAL